MPGLPQQRAEEEGLDAKIKEGMKGGKRKTKTRKYRKKNSSHKKNQGLLGFFSSFFN